MILTVARLQRNDKNYHFLLLAVLQIFDFKTRSPTSALASGGGSQDCYSHLDVLPTPKGGGFCFIGNSLFPVGNYGLTLPPQGTTTCPWKENYRWVSLVSNWRSPSFSMFIAAFLSRLWCSPQLGQSHSRMDTSLMALFLNPQLWQSCELGYHLSTLTNVVPQRFATYSKICRNLPNP